MIIGSFPQYLHMIDILGTHERPRDCRQSKKSASFFNNDRERFCSRAQLTKPCLPLITQSLVREVGLTFICPFINSRLQTQTSPQLLSVYCLPPSPLLWSSGALPTNLQTQEAGCRKSLLVANCWPSDPQERRFRAPTRELRTSGGSPAPRPDLARMRRGFCRLPWYSLINFVKLTSLVSLDIKLQERTHNQSWPLDAAETWLIFM